MYILELYQNNYSKDLVAFDSLEEGKEFVSKIPGYTIEKEDNLEYEYFDPKNIPDYMEIIYNENIVPLSKFMFESEEHVEILWKEISNLSVTKGRIIAGYSKIDAYITIKNFLESNGYEVDRSFFGSEDGEAIMYRKKESNDWHFLCHLDPSILDIKDPKKFVKEIIEDL